MPQPSQQPLSEQDARTVAARRWPEHERHVVKRHAAEDGSYVVCAVGYVEKGGVVVIRGLGPDYGAAFRNVDRRAFHDLNQSVPPSGPTPPRFD